MTDNESIHELKELAKEYQILYVEDNAGLRDKACILLKKFFAEVIPAQNGEEGLSIFKEFKPKIVITDIKMPVMDGLEMARRIKKISPHTKIIITSAFDDNEYLFESINIGVYRYLKKPLGIEQLTTVLLDGLKQLKLEDEDHMFSFYVENIFNYQKNLLILYNKDTPVIANNTLLEFFDVENLKDFVSKISSLGEQFLPHKSFLYNHDDIDWFKEAVANPDRLFHVKMYDMQDVIHHFVLKMIALEGKDDYFLVSMDDITELGLLKLFDDKTTRNDTKEQDKKSIINLLETVKRNSSEIKMQNLYKGLSITNRGLILTANEKKIELQCNFLQQKGAQNEGRIVLSSDFFPFDILCNNIKKVNFEQQTIEVDDLIFMDSSPVRRKTIRLEPDNKHTASLFYQSHKFGDGVKVVDISIESVKLSMLSIPAGFKTEEIVNIDMVFSVGNKHIIINTEAKVFKIINTIDQFYIVFLLEPSVGVKRKLVDYIAQRQMELIREFKGLQYG